MSQSPPNRDQTSSNAGQSRLGLLSKSSQENWLRNLNGWEVSQQGTLTRSLGFADFAQALEFVVAIGSIAERLNHHPDIQLGWGKVEISIWTHDAGGLTELDFTFAKAVEATWRDRCL